MVFNILRIATINCGEVGLDYGPRGFWRDCLSASRRNPDRGFL